MKIENNAEQFLRPKDIARGKCFKFINRYDGLLFLSVDNGYVSLEGGSFYEHATDSDKNEPVIPIKAKIVIE